MLSGLNQTTFIKQWGEPDSQIPLKKLAGFYPKRSLYLVVRSDDEADYSVWIYKKRDRILFFTKKKLVSHFKWTGFEEERSRSRSAPNPPSRIPPAFRNIPLALVA
jgi:hypothetical protein